MDSDANLIVRTSQPDWLKALAVIYKSRRPVVLVDDAGLGIDPANYTLLQMAMASPELTQALFYRH